MNDPIIHGKNPLERIVAVNVNDDASVDIWTEEKDGSVKYINEQSAFWILATTKINNSWIRLKGNLDYKWGKQFTNKESYQKTISYCYKNVYDTYKLYDQTEAVLIKDGYTLYKGMKHTEPSILSFDIETTGLYHNEDSKVILISNTYRKNGVVTKKLFSYDEYDCGTELLNQAELLKDWCNWVQEIDPAIICGHNIYTYDLPYLNYIANSCGVKLRLGRYNQEIEIASRTSSFRIDGARSQDYNKIRILGRETIDTMFLAIKYDAASKKYDSYALKKIIAQEGLEKKDRTFYDASQIRNNYKDPVEFEKIKEYCKDDSDDALALYDLMSPAFFYMTQSIPKTFQGIIESATGGQINALMVRSYLQNGHSIPKATPVEKYDGAISFGIPGIYKNVLKLDVKSMYPSIMLQYEVYDEDKDPNKHFLYLLKYFTDYRFVNKDLAKKTGQQYYKDLEQMAKIFINSGYGFLGTAGLQFNCPEGAAFVTKMGREIISDSIKWASSKEANEWIAIADLEKDA